MVYSVAALELTASKRTKSKSPKDVCLTKINLKNTCCKVLFGLSVLSRNKQSMLAMM